MDKFVKNLNNKIKSIDIRLRLIGVFVFLALTFGILLPLPAQPYGFLIDYFNKNGQYYIVEKLYQHRLFLHYKLMWIYKDILNLKQGGVYQFANFYLSQGKYKDAIKLYLHYKNYYLEPKSKNKENLSLPKFYKKLSAAYLISGEPEKAELYTNKAISIYEDIKAKYEKKYPNKKDDYWFEKININKINLGIALIEQNKLNEAKSLFFDILESVKKDDHGFYKNFYLKGIYKWKHKDGRFIGDYFRLLYCLSAIYYRENDFINAEKYAKAAYEELNKYDDNKGIDEFAHLYAYFATIYDKKGEQDKAREYFQKAFYIIDSNNSYRKYAENFCSYYFYSKFIIDKSEIDSIDKLLERKHSKILGLNNQKYNPDNSDVKKFCNILKLGIDY